MWKAGMLRKRYSVHPLSCLSFGRSFAAMEKAAGNAQKRMEQFCRGEDKKPSVKAELRQIKRGRNESQKIQPAKEQAR